VNTEQASKRAMQTPTWLKFREGCQDEGNKRTPKSVCRGSGDGMRARGVVEQHGKSVTMARSQLVIREGQTGSRRMADRPVVAKKLLKGGGAKGP